MLIPFTQLFHKHKIKASACLHIGANTGQEAAEYRKHGIKRVVWIEAHGPTFAKLVDHVAGYAGHDCLHACVADRDGDQITFNVANNGAQSSSMLKFGTHSVEHPTVKFTGSITMETTRVDTLLAKNGMEFLPGSFLNIDLQGAEMMALVGMGDTLDDFDHIYIEVNEAELYKGCPLVGEIDSFLAHRGFEPKDVKMTGSGWGDKYYKRVK